MRAVITIAIGIALAAGCSPSQSGAPPSSAEGASRQATAEGRAGAAAPQAAVPVDPGPEETRLGAMRRLTHGGSNAEAYFSADGGRLIFQATRPGESECDQIYTMKLDGTDVPRVSTGLGRTTCGYFFPSGDRILFSSTHHRDEACPPPPDRSRGYVWPLHPYDIFTARADGSDLRRLTDNPGYDAEATLSPDGERIVFTSHRDGDLNLFVMDADGRNLRQLTHREGYAGGAFFSPDGSRIVYRAYHPTDSAELEDYRGLLANGLVRPDRVELFLVDADGTNERQITRNGAANFAPYFHPNGRQIIFSSNLHDPQRRSFNLYLIDTDGTNLERVTFHDGFDSFPMFSPGGTKLVFVSNRGAGDAREYNIFVAEWREPRRAATTSSLGDAR